MHVPTCYPGLVHVRAEQHPAPEKKLADVQLEDVKLSHDLSTVPAERRSKKWTTMVIEDLERLRLLSGEQQRFAFALTGIGISGARPMVSAMTAYTCAKALACRVYRLPKLRAWGRGPLPGVWQFAERFIDLILPDFRCKPMSVEEWLETMPSRRRRALEKAWMDYQRSGWSKRCEKFSSFVKTEFLPGFGKDKVELVRLSEMVDRLIQGPADETHVIAGPFLKPLVKLLKERWPPDGFIFYGSAGPEALHTFLQSKLVDGEHRYFWCDFSMFDNTHSNDSWDFLEKIYKNAGITDSDFWRVMAAWRRPSGKIGPCRYRARVMNASGRDDTALANAILNGFATYLSACAAYLGKPLLTLTVEDVRACRSQINLSVCGDDSIGALPPMTEENARAFADAMSNNIAMFGFEAKLEHSEDLSRAVYLGMRPYPVNGKWFWGKTIGRAVYKLGWTMLESGRDLMAHITGVADMHMLCSRHVPILADLAAKIVELRCGAKRTPVVPDENRPWEWTLAGSLPYADDTIAYTARAYGVTVTDVRAAISRIQAITRLPCVLDCPIIKGMIHSDDL